MSSDQLQPEDTLDDRGVEDVLDEGYSPPDREPRISDGPETLDERLADEEPEVWDQQPDEGAEDLDDNEVGDRRAGRLMAPDEGRHEDIDSEMYAEDEGIDGAGASAEEAAVHVIDEES
ncbi:DUF5709 domain-containing protein [Nocardioides terrisoli]|uniref:DUF5709 domain-containing protein n=1 Tax=Nocardioides terrisoli TaxID=3388267 RepID=UPI00287B9170|nr:DUF5709 domain-containing protein [Nocardioides marmorisolisilvae]